MNWIPKSKGIYFVGICLAVEVAVVILTNVSTCIILSLADEWTDQERNVVEGFLVELSHEHLHLFCWLLQEQGLSWLWELDQRVWQAQRQQKKEENGCFHQININ